MLKFSHPITTYVYRHNREDSYGGVFIACHNTLISHEISYNDSQELIACKVKLFTNQSLIACYVYRPPNRSVNYIEASCGSLESIVLSYPHDILWIADDLNLSDINWTDYNIAGNTYPLPLNAAAFLNFVNTFRLTQIVDFLPDKVTYWIFF